MLLKKLSLAFAAVAAVLLSAGCTRPPEEDSNRIRFSIWGSVQQQKAEEEIIRAFREENPDVQVDLTVMGGRYPDKIQSMMVGNVAPDVIMVEMSLYDEWASRGVLVDLSEEFHQLHEESTFMPVPMQAFSREDGIFALPINCHGLVTFCNLDALEEAGVEIPDEGLTWDFIEEIAPRFSRRAGDPDAPTDYALMMPVALPLLWQNGVSLFDDLTNPGKVTVNQPGAVEVIRLMRRLQASGLAVPPEVAADEGTYQLFRDGRVTFFFSGRWMTPEFAGRTRFDWDVVPFPGNGTSNITFHGGTALAVWNGSHRQEAARRFVNFYTSRRGAEIAMKFQRTVPVYRDAAYGEEFLSLRPPESMHHFSGTMEAGASLTTLYAPGSQEVTRLLNGRIEQALSEPDIPADEIVAGIEEDLTRWLERRKERNSI